MSGRVTMPTDSALKSFKQNAERNDADITVLIVNYDNNISKLSFNREFYNGFTIVRNT